MKKSITLKEIVGFLPYGLKVMHTEFEPEGAFTQEAEIETISTECICFKSKWSASDYYFDDPDCEIKPIVRNLSDLTKEITHNGETFVPLLKIAKMLGYDDLIKFDDDGEGIIEYGFVERYQDDQQPYVFDYWQDGLFAIWYDRKDESHPFNHMTNLSVINLLQELHFDIYDWIKDGKAIDINTL